MGETKDHTSFGERAFAEAQAQFHVRTEGTAPLIEVAGEIDLSNVDALAGCLSVFDAGDAIILDLSHLTYIDSRGIAALVNAHRRGVRVTCRGTHGPVRRVVDICRLDAVLTIDDS